jgi:acyl-CoA synthetase (NDP forming)
MMADTELRAARRANLARLLNPRHIVFLGGERAGAAIATCRRAGYQGQYLAVSPKRAEIEGVPCVPSISDLPVAPDAAFLGIPAEGTIEAVGELARLGAGGAVCYASGFSELGEIGKRRNEALVEAAGGLALVGPNCFGIINYVNHGSLWTVPYPADAGPRGAAVIGQSGNVCINLSMNQRHVPFSYIISAGNQAVLGFEDYIEHLVEDPNVTAIGLFMEGIRDVPAFSAACLRAREKEIPLIAFRVGVSELGARLAASHTSSLVGQNELYDALFERLGILTTASVPQFLEALKTASVWQRPKGSRLAVFSSSGGDNGMAADFASAAGLDLPPPKPWQAEAVKKLLPDYGQVSNPLDFTAGYWGAEDLLTPMFTDMLSEGYDQGLLVIDHPLPELGEAVGMPLAAMVRALGAASRETGIPAAVASVNPESMPSHMRSQVLEEGLLPLQGLHDAGAVLGLWTKFCAMTDQKLPEVPLACAPIEDAAVRTVNEFESKQRLAAHGLPIPQGRVCSFAELAEAAAGMGGKLALKGLHDQLPHKTEMGAVALGLEGAEMVVAAAERMKATVAERAGLALDHFLLESMQDAPVAELIIGVKRDPQFGLVLVIGAGGIMVEVLRDAERLFLPATNEAVEAALRRLRTFPLLDGFRGRPKADLAAGVRAIQAVAGYAVSNRDTLVELDVNPLFLFADRAVAVDALIVEAADRGVSQ